MKHRRMNITAIANTLQNKINFELYQTEPIIFLIWLCMPLYTSVDICVDISDCAPIYIPNMYKL